MRRLVVAAVALGAFLTFLIQPLAARALLPAFGGSGSVWVTALVFYQIVLAAGYFLSHLVHTRLTIQRQKLTLVLLSFGSLLTLSVLPKPTDAGSEMPALRLLLSLATSVGPPFLVLAIAGPLIQGWAATQVDGASAGRDVYSMFAISNGASLFALAGYPLVMEPLLGVLQQGKIWEGLFAGEVLLLLAITRRFKFAGPALARQKNPGKNAPQPERGAGRARVILWLSWSASGVMLLTSTSGYIGQEIAAFPMLWVIPLSLYLVTWILAFSGTVSPGVLVRGCFALVSLALIVLAVDFRVATDWAVKLGFALGGMTLACFVVHASLYQKKPEKDQLTSFYAAVATGGAIGGVFSGVVAIQIFQDWCDLALAFSLVALLTWVDLVPHLRRHSLALLPREIPFWMVGLLSVGCCYLFVVTGMERPGLVYKHRDFHGLVRVVEADSGIPMKHRLVMFHGATIHGSQFLNSNLRGKPTTYFGRGTGVEIAVHAQRLLLGAGRGLNIGVVGLGVGTMAAHLREQDTMCFYELSPAVAELAHNGGALGNSGSHFSYLGDAAGEVKVVVGDARISLASELKIYPNGNSYDLLVLDAFAGDAVPFHLLTREAFSLYTQHLSDTGMIAVHVSSNWLDLVPVVYAWADAERWQALTISTRGNASEVSENHAVWVMLFRDQTMLEILAEKCRPLMAENKIIVQNLCNVNYGSLRLWTDNHSDLLTLMRSNIQLREGMATRPVKLSYNRRP